MKLVTLLAFAFAILSTTAIAQGRPAPFGLPMGTPINKLKKTGSFGVRHFLVRPPTPNPNFERYEVTATPPHGVCAIRAYSFGVQTQEEATVELRRVTRLLSVYGRPRDGQISKEVSWLNIRPKDIGDYTEKYWNRGLPNNLDFVSAEIGAGPNGGFDIEVFYGYKNLRRCNDWEPGQNKVGL